MPSNNEQILVTRSTADEGDLYFVKSPFYWQNNNPSALAKTWHGYLRSIGHENYVESAEPQDKTEFETEIIQTNIVIEDFRKFIDNGQKFGTINLTNADAESSYFEMLKRMYGSVAYIVFEEREYDRKDPAKKHERHVSFLTEYDLCALTPRYFHSDESYYHGIFESTIPSAITSTGQMKRQNEYKETSFERTRKKLYRNGFSLGRSNNHTEYAPLHCPTENEYFSNQKREKLDSQDLMNLLWRFICDAHRDDGDPLKKSRTIMQDLAYELYRANIVGFGWMPCLLAKRELNELDRCVLYLYEKSGIHNDLHKAAHSVETKDEDKPYAPPGTHQILVFKNKTHEKFQPTERYPLDKVVKISRAELGQYRITDVNGQELLTDYIDLVDDIPQVDIKISPEVPDRYVVTGRYADGRCIRYEMDAAVWKEHSYEIDKYIPGSLRAIKEYNLKQELKEALDKGELSIPNSYAIPLKWDDTVYWVKDTLDSNKIKVGDYTLSDYEGALIYQPIPPTRYISVPEYTYGSNGTYNDLKQPNK